MKVAIEKVRQFLREVDLNAVDDKGKPLYTFLQIINEPQTFRCLWFLTFIGGCNTEKYCL